MPNVVISIIRWLIHKLSIVVLANAVAVAIPLYAIGVHVTDSGVLKSWLRDSDSYQNVINESINLIEIDSNTAGSEGSLGDSLEANPFIDQTVVIEALSATLDAEFLRSETEKVIDGVYVWLESNQEIPSFTFSLTSKQQELNQRLTEAFTEQFTDIPQCRPDQLGIDFNLLESFCIPPGVDIDTEVERLVAELAGDNGLLAQADFNGKDMVQTQTNESGLNQQQVEYAKTAFEGFKYAPLYFLLAGLLSIPLIIISSKSSYNGLYEIGYTMFSSSLFVFVAAVVLTRFEGLITSLVGDNGGSESTVNSARAIFEPFLEVAVSDVALLTAQLSGAVLFVGSILVGFGIYIRYRHRAEEEAAAIKQLQKAQTMRSVKAIKRKARKHPKPYKDKTLDPKTKKPLKASNQKITIHHARKIARHPDYKKKKISKLLDDE